MSRKETIHLYQRNPQANPTRTTGQNLPTRSIFGIDFWHAVEFSRNGHTLRNQTHTRPRGNPTNLRLPAHPVKPQPTGSFPDRRQTPTPHQPPSQEAQRLVETPGGTDHLTVSVPPSRAASRTIGSRPTRVKTAPPPHPGTALRCADAAGGRGQCRSL
jgi:hypothetical protein